MLSKKSTIEKKFEEEIWLYLDGDLSLERIEYWKEQIAQNSSLKKILNETELLFNKNKIEAPELDDAQFDKMIESAVKSNESFVAKMIDQFKETTSLRGTYYKLIFGSIIILIALTVTLIDRNPNPINKISNELLEWDDTEISKGISKVQDALFNRDEQYKEYIQYQLSKDPWKRNITTIEKRINKIKNEINQASL